MEEPGDKESRAVVRMRRGREEVAEVVPRSRWELLVGTEGGGGEGGGEEEGIVIKLL